MLCRADAGRVLSRLRRGRKAGPGDVPRGFREALLDVAAASHARLAFCRQAVVSVRPGLVELPRHVFDSADLSKRLEGCSSATLFMTTLGPDIDSLVSAARGDALRHLILDAAASETVEECARWFQRNEKKAAEATGSRATARFSPGFGDLGLENQAYFTQLFPGLGVTVGEGFMLVPLKTVTGVVGWRKL